MNREAIEGEPRHAFRYVPQNLHSEMVKTVKDAVGDWPSNLEYVSYEFQRENQEMVKDAVIKHHYAMKYVDPELQKEIKIPFTYTESGKNVEKEVSLDHWLVLNGW